MEFATLSQKIKNYGYAPGMATYGADGEKGVPGQNGTAIFYTDLAFTKLHDDLITAVDRIRASKDLFRNSGTALNRKYMDGDLILTPSAEIYKITGFSDYAKNYISVSSDKSSVAYTLFFAYAGTVSGAAVDNSVYGISDRGRVYFKYPAFINSARTGDSSDFVSDSIFTVQNTVVGTKAYFFSAITRQQENTPVSLDMYFDPCENAGQGSEGGSFHISAETPVVLDSPYISVASSNGDLDTFDDYSPILTENSLTDSATGWSNICSLLTWRFNGDDVSKIDFMFPDSSAGAVLAAESSVLNKSFFVKFYTAGSGGRLVSYMTDASTGDTFDVSGLSSPAFQGNIPSALQNAENTVMAVSLISRTEAFIKKEN